MKICVTLLLSLAAGLATAAPFDVPASCVDVLTNEDDICSVGGTAADEPGSFDVETYVLIYPEAGFNTPREAAEYYFVFDDWQQHYRDGDNDTITIDTREMSPLEVAAVDGPHTYRRNYFVVDTRLPLIGQQRVRGVAYYEDVSEPGASTVTYYHFLAKGDVPVPAGEPLLKDSEGLKKQEGTLSYAACEDYDFCEAGDGVILLRYKSRLRHEVTILPAIAAGFAAEQMRALFAGMYF